MSWQYHQEYSDLQQKLLHLIHSAVGPCLPDDLMKAPLPTRHASRVHSALMALQDEGAIAWTVFGWAVPGRAIRDKDPTGKLLIRPIYSHPKDHHAAA